MPSHHRLYLNTPRRLLGVALLLMFALTPSIASACAIDNVASLSVDGVRANVTTNAPVNAKTWAPFTVGKAFAVDTTMVANEDQGELARSLQPSMLHHAYRWTFGDGSTVVGPVGSHRYSKPGDYRLDVFGFDARAKQWARFDSALVHVVAPGQLLQANLGYQTLGVIDVIVNGLSWVVNVALVALIAVVVVAAVKPAPSRTMSTGR